MFGAGAVVVCLLLPKRPIVAWRERGWKDGCEGKREGVGRFRNLTLPVSGKRFFAIASRTRSARRVAVARARGGETRARGSGGERGRGRTFGVARGARRSEGRARWRGAWKCDATDRLDALFTRQIFHLSTSPES